MAEKDTVFSSKMKFEGVFNFKEFYKFCYDWLVDEVQQEVFEQKYSEKISGNTKDIDIEWVGTRKLTDYFRFDTKVTFKILRMAKIEINKDGQKISANQGIAEVKIKGIIVRDYLGKFEKNGTQKFLRAIYERWIIPSRIEEIEEKIIEDCDEFLSQAKAFLDIEGNR